MFNDNYSEDFASGMDMEEEEFDEENFSWEGPGFPGSISFNASPGIGPNRARYDNAYGNYQGGYGPGGGYGPLPFLLPPPPPPLTGPMRGRRYGPGRPPRWHIEDRALKYLSRCGVPKDNLRNLPHDLLVLIQPEHCGLCDFYFDSFATSRIHYLSKNHLKNQKKWLSKRVDGRSYNEVPFKARNMYCELCDVQITSKSHGDAHYSGKPHHGIVEGRKKPKNPLLLQSNMQQRLEQLIRREKRFMKSVVPKPGEDETVKELKSTSLDLYCDICKTAVTCSEQMTSHLNGKKHLSKEKQHILKMMKGKTEENDKEMDEEVEEREVEEDVEEKEVEQEPDENDKEMDEEVEEQEVEEKEVDEKEVGEKEVEEKEVEEKKVEEEVEQEPDENDKEMDEVEEKEVEQKPDDKPVEINPFVSDLGTEATDNKDQTKDTEEKAE